MAVLPIGRGRSLAGRLLVLQLAVVAVVVTAGAAITTVVARERTTDAARERAIAIARTLAAAPALGRALQARDPSATLQPLAERVRARTGVGFVVVMSPEGVRYTHPDPSKIGGHFVGRFRAAARGGTVVETTTGTLGRSVRAVVPVREGRTVVGLVAVGVLTAAIGHEVATLLPAVLTLAAVTLVLGSALSLLVARRLKRQTLGLEPEEITAMYAHHDATLHALREGVVAYDEHGRRALVNDHARRLLGTDLAELDAAVASGELRDDAPLIAGDRVLLASTRAVVRDGRRAGTVVTLRDRTEVEALGRELDTVRALADALRAQAHESANRLHAIAGLIELGRGDEAARLAGAEAAATQELIGRLGEGIEEPALVALLLGKAAAASERGVELHVGRGARLRAGFPPATLVTIVGNLIDNALDARDPSRPGRIDVMLVDDGAVAVIEVADDGPGFPPDLLDRVFEAGVTTKRGGSGPRGLGLALVRRAVVALGGEVEAHNDGGAVVTVTLPHAAADAPRAGDTPVPQAAGRPEGEATAHRSVAGAGQ